jgi:hypothetical protein
MSTQEVSAENARPADHTGPTLCSFLGPPPLLEGEDLAGYNELLARITAAVKPADIFEEIWVADIVHLTWEVARWRRLQQHLIKASTHTGVQAVMGPMQTEPGEALSLSLGWASGRARVINKVKNRLASANLTVDAITALTVAKKISEIEHINHWTMNAEMRRNAALREIERHRATFGKALRSVSDNVVDAEFEPIEAPQIEGQKAA